MNWGARWKLACVLLLLCSACGDDDQGSDEPAATGGERDGGRVERDGASPDDQGDPGDDEPASAGRSGAGGDAPSDGGEGPVAGSDSPMNDAGTPPPQMVDAGGTIEPGDAAVAGDAGGATDCESLAACCEQLDDRPQAACERAIAAADDAACAAFARRACGPDRGDGGGAMPMPCEAVLECCAALEGREQAACEAAASAPEGRACDRAVETYCRQ